MQPVCHSNSCPFKPATYCCQRCRAEVCYCDGDGTVAVCDGCWNDLDRAGYSEADMVAEFGNGDHTLCDGGAANV